MRKIAHVWPFGNHSLLSSPIPPDLYPRPLFLSSTLSFYPAQSRLQGLAVFLPHFWTLFWDTF